jgi:hypothetical protein
MAMSMSAMKAQSARAGRELFFFDDTFIVMVLGARDCRAHATRPRPCQHLLEIIFLTGFFDLIRSADFFK